MQRFPAPILLLAATALWSLWVVLSFAFVNFGLAPAPQALTDSPAAGQKAGKVVVDIERVKGWGLFGAGVKNDDLVVAEPVLSAAEEDAEETRLAVQLEGVILSDQPDRGRAVITHKGAQDSYAVGDSLPVGPKVVLHRLLADRVILDNQGKLESLLLYDDAGAATVAPAKVRPVVPTKRRQATKPAPSRPKPKAVAQSEMQPVKPASAGRTPVTRSASLLGASTSERVATLTNTVRISPSVDAANQIIGYRVAPADNALLFKQLGLRSGDLVTHVNGVAVGGIGNVLEVYRIINRADVADFTVMREGQQQSLRLDLQN